MQAEIAALFGQHFRMHPQFPLILFHSSYDISFEWTLYEKDKCPLFFIPGGLGSDAKGDPML